ncbi:MAG: CDP-alcohol phosphatidyltransferase family protein [Aestuariibaculum sp.]
MKTFIPNAITLLNLFCGCIAAILAVNNNFSAAALFVFLGIFFDFFDGLAARKLNVQSELGIQLDSLADMVTSGLVPGIVMYKLLLMATGEIEITTHWDMLDVNLKLLPLLGLCVTLGSAYRLAKFNIDEEQKNYFKGLPTPANALLILSLPLILEFQNSDAINTIIINKWTLLLLTLLSCYLLNANIKLFALKFKDWSLKNNVLRYGFIVLCAVLLLTLKFIAIPIIILTYIILSVLNRKSIH